MNNKEQLREDVLNILHLLVMHYGYSTDEAADDIIELFKPIQLPTDEEICDNSPFNYITDYSKVEYDNFMNGARWMRDKIGQ
jgi:hypothetical protein